MVGWCKSSSRGGVMGPVTRTESEGGICLCKEWQVGDINMCFRGRRKEVPDAVQWEWKALRSERQDGGRRALVS